MNCESQCFRLSQTQTATIDDNSAAQMRTLLLIVTLVSNFPVLIVGMGIILLLVLVVLFCRNRQKKVGTLLLWTRL